MNYLKPARLVAMLAALPLMFGLAQAQSLTGNVGSAGITPGEQSLETRFGFDDADNWAARVHYDRAISGWYQVRLIAAATRPDGQDWDYDSFTVENWFQWREEASDNTGFNGGLRLSYTLADGNDVDEVELRLTLTDKFARDWEWRANVIGEIEAGDGSDGGVALETRGQLTRAIGLDALASTDWRAGVELFSEYGNSRDIPGLDDQAHQIGPVVKASWDNGLYLQSALRVGLTGGADDMMLKLFVGREF